MKRFPIVLAAFGYIGLMPCSEAAPLDDACNSYGKHEYANCLKQLDSIPSAKRNAKSEYYKALTLQALHRYGDANDAFRKVATQKSDLRLASMARQGMVGFAHMPKQTSWQSAAATAENSASIAASIAEKKNSSTRAVNNAASAPVDQNNLPGISFDFHFKKTRNSCH